MFFIERLDIFKVIEVDLIFILYVSDKYLLCFCSIYKKKISHFFFIFINKISITHLLYGSTNICLAFYFLFFYIYQCQIFSLFIFMY